VNSRLDSKKIQIAFLPVNFCHMDPPKISITRPKKIGFAVFVGFIRYGSPDAAETAFPIP
jgi:hypothetical protein